MGLKLRTHIVLLLLVLLCGAGCRRFVNPLIGDKVVARVGDQILSMSDVQSIFTRGVTPEDSLKLLESYVDMWVKKQLKIQEAERRFPESVPEIERMVQEYRNSLLSVKLDDYYIESRLDTVFTPQEIAQYYNENRADYLLDRAIVRGRVVKVPDAYRQRAKIKELMRYMTNSQRQDLTDLCLKNNFELREFTTWTDYSDFLALLPKDAPGDKLFRAEGVQELRDGGAWYYFMITDRRSEGDALPLERAEGAIKRILTTHRRAGIIRACEDSLYNAAKSRKTIVINLD